MRHFLFRPLASLLIAAPVIAQADPPVIEGATARQSGADWTISVTLSHVDTGWDHYADGWRVLDKNGTVLGLRVLAHPHVNEQPFTRSLSNVKIPDKTTSVLIEARDNLTGWGKAQYQLSLD